MTAPEVITRTGEFACWLAGGVSGSLPVDLSCSPQGYFDAGLSVFALAFIVLVVAANEARRWRKRSEGYV
jgi:hypothetical protein